MKEKKRLSAKGWLWMFGLTLLLVVLFLPVLNMLADPFGAFGDRILQWWSYDMTSNTRLSKISYLEQNADRYDSFLIGCSDSGSLPVEDLNNYLNASFYNLMSHGAGIEAVEETANYVLTNHTPRNIVLMLNPLIADAAESGQAETLADCRSWRMTGEDKWEFYRKFLFADPKDSFRKLSRYFSRAYLQDDDTVYDPETGAYDDSRRNVEPIGDLDSYLERKTGGVFHDSPEPDRGLPRLKESMEAVARIKARCEECGTNLLVICQPCCAEFLNSYSEEELSAFFNALSYVTDYWDFSLTSVSYEPRYFYDETHFRSAVGTMLLARIFHDGNCYAPDRFGRYIEKGAWANAPECEPVDAAEYTVQIPILRYGDLTEGTPENADAVSLASFEAQMAALSEAGFTPVGIDDLRSYVKLGALPHGVDLPEKPVLITFDGGYESFCSLAWPVLQKYGFQAVVFAEGVSIGKDTYKDTGAAMIPHFSLEQAREMTDSGLITVASRGWDLCEVRGLDSDPIRPGALRREGESEKKYAEFLTEDALRMRSLLGEGAAYFSCPDDLCDELCLVVLSRAGVRAAVSGEGPCATLIKGLPQSLYEMPRNTVSDDLSGTALVAMLEKIEEE